LNCLAPSQYLPKLTYHSATVGVGGAFSQLDGNHHAFSLADPAISYPNRPDTVRVSVLLLVSVVAPGVIIFLVSMLLVPGRTVARDTSPALKWRRRFWEWNTGWMGLGVALAGAFMVTEGLKDLLGKPRPDFLARCDPDVSLINQYAVSGLGAVVENAPIMVDYRICRNQSKFVTNDGFAAWPSGHASFSWAGMLYLTLFLCAKFAISIPYLAPRSYSREFNAASFGTHNHHRPGDIDQHQERIPLRNQAAAPPLYLLILAFAPIGTAFFITVSRWFDYRHAGFDIISGAILGIFFAWFGFRWYHLPIRTGAGWSWGARSRERAFYTGLGIPTYVGDEGWRSAKAAAAYRADVESGDNILGSGHPDQAATALADGGDRSEDSVHKDEGKSSSQSRVV
jgi:membrane-associated phospholipid phosphatase